MQANVKIKNGKNIKVKALADSGVITQNLQSWIYEITLYWVTQENSIESSVQTSLSYILLQMVCASYCVPYPK